MSDVLNTNPTDDFMPNWELIRLLDLAADHHIEVSVDQPLEGFDRCYAHDPFGNRIEFMQQIGD